MKTIEEIQAELDAIIARVGWAVQGVFAEDDEPGFCYTVGLSAKDLPELITFGLSQQTGALFLNRIAQRMIDGETFALDTDINELAEGAPTRLIAAARTATDNFMFATEARYPAYKALQMVWPDRHLHWPWEAAFDARMKPLQPILRAALH